MRFKVWVMVLLLMSLTVVQASAEMMAPAPASASSFEIGLESGMNFSYLLGSDASNLNLGGATSSRMGFVGGVYLSLNFSSNFSIRPEALYEQKGAQISGTQTNLETDYFEVPVLAKIGLGLPFLNPSLLIGPSFDWNTIASLPSGTGAVNTNDLGLVAGLDFDFSKFCINARYELGVNNVSSSKNLQNGTFTILMGYSFM
jgi:opacity protein-like surface antigen